MVISRLAYRKGVDLLVATAPKICALFPEVRFIVGERHLHPNSLLSNLWMTTGGDGPKLIDLLQMREKHLLQNRISLRGPIRHSDVRKVSVHYPPSMAPNDLIRAHKTLLEGSIFLNTSLTESFGIAILEAACAGLYVVSTKVGGVPEVLPDDMISFALPDEDGSSNSS